MTLFDEVADAESSFRVVVDESLVTRVHAGRYILCLASLTTTGIVTIEGLKNQCAQIERINRGVRRLLYGVPA